MTFPWLFWRQGTGPRAGGGGRASERRSWRPSSTSNTCASILSSSPPSLPPLASSPVRDPYPPPARQRTRCVPWGDGGRNTKVALALHLPYPAPDSYPRTAIGGGVCRERFPHSQSHERSRVTRGPNVCRRHHTAPRAPFRTPLPCRPGDAPPPPPELRRLLVAADFTTAGASKMAQGCSGRWHRQTSRCLSCSGWRASVSRSSGSECASAPAGSIPHPPRGQGGCPTSGSNLIAAFRSTLMFCIGAPCPSPIAPSSSSSSFITIRPRGT